ncbi:fatty acid synthase S-acetyltransferase [Aspergillus novoparasiticus]|uniref:Fatty acid synthase S-acetyltransferase n=1 Tax=Aspergillus novoparasiticus TaxID=986946 RepID=A0A5N6EDR4_9EURO|nr:fatty acid synthase S-acetyltransferase [Aspergillus novoparasiticus]
MIPSTKSQKDAQPTPMPIAVIGVSYRLPGAVTSEDDFWRFCSKAESAWSEIPRNRFTPEAFYHQNPDRLGSHEAKGGYFLRQDVSAFDAPFFGISSEEARAMDPQQRLLLECAYEALESAGASNETLANEDVAVLIGGTSSDYGHNNSRDPEQIPRYNVSGNGAAFLANRLSHFFNFRGPSFTVDTACSSSLTALHVACQSLRQGESSHALVGSCHLNLIPESFITFSSNSLLNSSGKCHSFDQEAKSGYGRGEGVACVFLRPLEAAIEANDNILAVISNTGINQDGYTPSISAPSAAAQERLIRSVYESAGIDPRLTAFVEAHGTGTHVGDPVEVRALYEVFGKERDPTTPLLIGSAKSHFGHAEGASGMISLVKAVLMLHRGYIIPNADYKEPRKDIPWADWNIKVSNRFMPWPRELPYLSINNFGLGGANAHVVLCSTHHVVSGNLGSVYVSAKETVDTRRVYVLSGNTEDAVLRQVRDLELYLERHPAAFDGRIMYNLAYTLGERRARLPWKLVTSARTADELLAGLCAKGTRPRKSSFEPTIAFVFTGQGAQWSGMGRELLDYYPVFREVIEAVDKQLITLSAGFTVTEQLRAPQEQSQIFLPHISQTACTAVQVALTELLRSWGVAPCAVLGHSSGEIAAAYAAGIISLHDAVLIAYARGKAVLDLQVKFPEIKGAMVAIGAPVETVHSLLHQVKAGHACVACINSPHNVTVSGDKSAIQELHSMADLAGLFVRRLRVTTAYHSHHMRLVADSYRETIRMIRPQSSALQFYSSTRAQRLESDELDASYWVENLVGCVQFASNLERALGTQKLNKPNVDVLIEVGPHPALCSSIQEILQFSGHSERTEYLSTLRRNIDGTTAMHDLATNLILKGVNMRMGGVNIVKSNAIKPRVIENLPRYAWDHRNSYWHSTRLGSNHLFKPFPRHDLLGSLSAEFNELEPMWRTVIRLEDNPWIKDHRVQGRATFPLAAFVLMATEGARQSSILRKAMVDTFKLRELHMEKMLVIPDSTPVEIVTCIRPHNTGTSASSSTWNEVRIFSWVRGTGWAQNFRALVSTQSQRTTNTVDTKSAIEDFLKMQHVDAIRSSCTEPYSTELLYEHLEDVGFQYDRIFRCLRDAVGDITGTMATSAVTTPKAVEDNSSGLEQAKMRVHPTIVDLCFQTAWLTFGASTSGLETLYVPTYVEEIILSANLDIRPSDELTFHAKRTSPVTTDRPVSSNVWGCKEGCLENPFIGVKGLELKPIDTSNLPSDRKLTKKIYDRFQMEHCLDFIRSPLQVQYRGGKSPQAEERSDTALSNRLTAFQQAGSCLRIMSNQKPNLRILEIGTSLLSTAQILASLPNEPNFQQYVFADISGFDATDKTTYLGKWSDSVQWQPYSSLEVYANQGQQEESFDIILVTNIAPSRPTMDLILPRLRQTLVDGGKLVIVTPEDSCHSCREPVSQVTLGQALQEYEFSGIDLVLDAADPQDVGRVFVSSSTVPKLPAQTKLSIVHNGDMDYLWLSSLALTLEATIGLATVIQSLDEPVQEGSICVFVGDLKQPILANISSGAFEKIRQLILRSAGLLWITREAYLDCKVPSGALVYGLARTVRSELDLPFVTLDLGSQADCPLLDEAQAIASVLNTVFHRISILCSGDYEFTVRDGVISVPRVVSDPKFNDTLSRMSGSAPEIQPLLQSDRPLTLTIKDFGALESLYFTDAPKRDLSATSLPPHCIEVDVRCVGLNFKDVMHANKQLSADGFGLECSGVVIRVGTNVNDIRAGDRVCAFASNCFATRVTCPAACAWRIGPQMSFEVAASIPAVFATAVYSLLYVGRLQRSEKVLIHAAAGGVGQAAIMIAQSCGAEVFATVGNADKKAMLHDKYGIPESHIFFSRDLSFVDRIAESTQGLGVDVVLNCLAGELLQGSLKCLASFGRFVEIGKKDILMNSSLEMSPFANNISFSAVDLSSFAQQRPGLLKDLLAQSFKLWDAGQIHPVYPLNIFDATDLGSAFKLLQSGQSMGKVVVHFKESSMVQVFPARRDPRFLEPNATYIVVGGTGGLGRSITSLLAKHGAKNILIVSRHGPASEGVGELIASLATQGVTAQALSCDVADKNQVERTLLPYLRQAPPTRGVVHSAMVLRDTVFENLTHSAWNTVLRPKVDGVYNLSELLDQLDCPLDFFVALSSVTGIVGNRGQSAYAAANTFLDAFTQYNKARGLPFTSIDLPYIKDIGVLANDVQARDLFAARLGADGMNEDEFQNLLTTAIHPQAGLGSNSHIMAIIPLSNGEQSFWARDARFSNVIRRCSENAMDSTNQTSGDALKRIRSFNEAYKLVTQGLAHKVSAIMMCAENTIDATTSISRLNLDSLSAIEIRKWLSREFEVSLQLLEILTCPSLGDLATLALTRSNLVPSQRKVDWKLAEKQ